LLTNDKNEWIQDYEKIILSEVNDIFMPMGFVSFDNGGRLLDRFGKPVHMVGINYVASYICTNFWEDWRPEVIEKDLADIADLGFSAVRIPMHWGFMEPEEGKYNKDFEAKFKVFVEMCRKYQLYIMPWFLVGVATRDYDVPFRNGRPFFTGEMVYIAENHLKHFIEPYKDEEQILFWDICDEPEYYSRFASTEQLPYHRQNVARWVKCMYDAIKSVDQNHLVTLGFGVLSTENFGTDVRDMAEILDLMVITCYPFWPDEGLDTCRKNYSLSYHVKMNKRNTPVFTCEAPGYSSVLYSEEIIRRYFKTGIYSNLLNGSTGVLPWVYNDFDQSIWYDCPLESYLAETSFGIVTVDGRLKPSGQELRDFAAFSKKTDLGKYRPKKAQVAVVVPEGYYPDSKNSSKLVFTAFVMAKGASVDVDLVWSCEDLSQYKMLILPSISGIPASHWEKIRRFVENGGILYYAFQHTGGCSSCFSDLFGVEIITQEKDYGYTNLAVKKDWGCWSEKDTITLTNAKRNSILRAKAETAEVLFEMEDGNPALLKNAYGKGVTYLATWNMFHGLMDIPYKEFVNSEYFKILDFVVGESEVERLFKSDNAIVEVGCLEDSETGSQLLIAINHHNDTVQAKLSFDRSMLPEGAVIVDFDSNEVIVTDAVEVTMEAADVRVYKVTV